jgi:hypothetical protein
MFCVSFCDKFHRESLKSVICSRVLTRTSSYSNLLLDGTIPYLSRSLKEKTFSDSFGLG